MGQATLKNNKKSNKVNEESISTKDVKKKSSALQTLLLIIIIIFLTSILALGSIFIFNIAGLKNDIAKIFINVPLIGTIMKPLVENKTPQDIEREQIEIKKKDLSLQMQGLNDKQKEIEGKEIELQAKEEIMNSKIAQLDSKLQSVAEQVEYIEKMDTSKAAQVLLNMSEKSSVIQILRNMKKDKAVGIISLMDPLQAAQLLEELSKTPVQDDSINKLEADKKTLP